MTEKQDVLAQYADARARPNEVIQSGVVVVVQDEVGELVPVEGES